MRASPQRRSHRVSGSPVSAGRRGTVALIDLADKKTTLTPQVGERGRPRLVAQGRRDLVHGDRGTGANRSLYAVTLAGTGSRRWPACRAASSCTTWRHNGRVLLTRESPRVGMLGMLHGDTRERDLSLLDYSFVGDLSPDGKTLLFDEEGEAGGANYTVYPPQVRPLAGRPPRRRATRWRSRPTRSGRSRCLPAPNSPLILLPTGDGQRASRAARAASARSRPRPGFRTARASLFAGNAAGPRRAALRCRRSTAGSRAPITTEGIDHGASGLRRLARRQVRRGDRPGPQGECCFRWTAEQPRADRGTRGRRVSAALLGGRPVALSSGSAATCRPGSHGSTSRAASASSGRSCIPADPSGVERISNVARDARREVLRLLLQRACCRISSSSKA